MKLKSTTQLFIELDMLTQSNTTVSQPDWHMLRKTGGIRVETFAFQSEAMTQL